MIYTGSALYVLVQGQYDGPPFDQDVVLIKYNNNMVFQWSQLINGAGNPDDYAVDLAVGPSGSILVLVKSGDNFLTLRYGTTGTLLSSATYDSGLGNDAPAALRFLNNITYVAGTRPAATGRQTVLIKYDNALTQQWALLSKQSIGATNDEVTDMTIDTSGNIYVCGNYYTSDMHPFVVKANASGTKLWTCMLSYNGMTPMRVFTDNNAEPFMYCNGSPDRYIKINKTNGIISSNVIVFNSANTNFEAKSVDKGSTNDIYIIGNFDTTYAGGSYDFGYKVSKLNSGGGRLWDIDDIGPAADFGYYPRNITVRDDSKVYYLANESWSGYYGTDESEFYGTIHAVSPASGLREEDITTAESGEDIFIYPNPASGKIHFTLNNLKSEKAHAVLINI
jgi:hypothetical protein